MQPLPLVIILCVLNHVAFNGSRIAVSLWALHWQSTAFTVGLLIALYALLPALVSVAAGRWIDRVGVNLPLRLGSAGVLLGCATPALLPGLPALVVTAVLVGLSFTLITLATYHAVGHWSSEAERPAAFSYVALGYSVSAFIAPMLTGLCIDQIGHRFTFLVLALFGALPTLLLLAQRLPEHAAAAPDPDAAAPGPVWQLLRDPELRRLFIAIAVLSVAWDIYLFAMPVYGSHIGLSASQIGIVMGSFAAATFAVRLGMPLIAARLPPWPLLALALGVAGVAYAGVPLVSGVGPLMALMFVLGLGLGAPQPIVLTLLHRAAPAGRAGEALGLRTTFINISQAAMPLVFGAVGALVGIAPLFFAMATALAGGCWMARRVAGERAPGG